MPGGRTLLTVVGGHAKTKAKLVIYRVDDKRAGHTKL